MQRLIIQKQKMIKIYIFRWRQDLSYPLQETDLINIPNVPMFVSINAIDDDQADDIDGVTIWQ